MKPKRCKVCKQTFEPFKPLQVTCGWECAHNYAVKQREKKEADAEKLARKAIRIAKEKLKTRADWMRETQHAVNAYVRERDAHLPCISCGRFHDGQWHAGHYLSVGARPNLRFDAERNIHRQCAPCNTHLSGNLINYRIGLVQRIGLEAVEALEADMQPRKYSTDELKAIKAHYTQKLKELKAKPSLAELALAYPETYGEHA